MGSKLLSQIRNVLMDTNLKLSNYSSVTGTLTEEEKQYLQKSRVHLTEASANIARVEFPYPLAED